MATQLHADFERALVIPDIHHDIPWVDRIMDAEFGHVDGVILLGDLFDSFAPRVSAKRVIYRIQDLMHEIPTVWNVGNHDIQYLWWKHRSQLGHHPTRYNEGNPFASAGYSKARAQKIVRYMDRDLAACAQMMTVCQGYLISHAGVNSRLCAPVGDDAYVLEDLFTKSQAALAAFDSQNPFFYVPRRRNGVHPFGGVLWQDWNDFQDDLPWPQIVGHTTMPKEINPRGRSWCLDNEQTTYGVLENGVLTIKAA